MRRVAPALLALTVIPLAASCGVEPTNVREFSIPVYATAGESDHFNSPLAGENEVPAADTKARGNAIFWLSDDGSSLHYRLIVANIDNVTQSHIHLAPEGVNGPVVVFLFGLIPGGVTQNGILAEADLTAANLIPRPTIGFGGTMAELVARMRSGGAYVNVHTHAFPGGEVRGQVAENGPTS